MSKPQVDPILPDGVVPQRISLSVDPIYRYIQITRRSDSQSEETFEDDLVSSPWVQRLRRIHQLQTAWWVFATAEHSRFPHSLGAMHLAGKWASHLYPSLASVSKDTPSIGLVEETLRIAGLLHDVGHGPFSHFFDETYSKRWGIDHEIVGRKIILERLGQIISKIRRSPSDDFLQGESIDPRWVAYLICENELSGFTPPPWLKIMHSIMIGPFSADNMDYVPRDAYACGIEPGNIDIDRMIHYSFISEKGLTIHNHGEAAIFGFLSARLFLYQQVYYHRTVRRIDLQLKEIMSRTLKLVFGGMNPIENLDSFLHLTEWTLLGEVENWITHPADQERMELGKAWKDLFERRLRWELVFSDYAEGRNLDNRLEMNSEEFAQAIRQALPPSLRSIEFAVDVAAKESRATNNPLAETSSITFYDSLRKRYTSSNLHDLFRRLPERFAVFRIYARDHIHQAELIAAAEKVLGRPGNGN